MQNKNEILNELLEISQLIASINRKNDIYALPSGYFESFPGQLIIHIKTETRPVSVQDEMEILSPDISRIDKKNVFGIPDHYFESLPEQIGLRLKAGQAADAPEELALLSPLLSALDKKAPFSAPEGYFNELPANLVMGMNAVELVNQELDNSSSLSNKNPYEVPAAYFDNLAENILNKIRQPQQGKLISFKKRKPWLKFAAAAMVTGILLTIGLLNFNKQNTAPVADPSAGLSKVSDQEITSYLDNQDLPTDQPANNNTAALDFNENDISDLMADVPDNELLEYAHDHAVSKDLITN